MLKKRLNALILIILALGVAFFVYKTEINKESSYSFKLGLDLRGGSHLVYKADVSKVQNGDISGAMSSLRDVIERRVNMFGVSEPIVQTEQGGVFGGGDEYRLIVELPGITDLNEAIKMIGKTPSLDFRLIKTEYKNLPTGELEKKGINELFGKTGLDGALVKRAELVFDQTTGEPKVGLEFNSEGSKLFEKITGEHIGEVLAIFLDDVPISTPNIREAITGGRAEISGRFTVAEAKQLVRDLNYGALPLPVELVNTETITATLGETATRAGVKAGLIAFIVIALFLILWYRLAGLLAVVALFFYIFINLALFKLIPVTLTATGIAGFVLSLGMAVDANILIFERIKEELKKGKNLELSIKEGFERAWLSIRDSNLSSIITATILFMFASTNVVKGFALVFGIGVVASMFSAITFSRVLIKAFVFGNGRVSRFLYSSGFHKGGLENEAIK